MYFPYKRQNLIMVSPKYKSEISHGEEGILPNLIPLKDSDDKGYTSFNAIFLKTLGLL